MNTAKLKAFAPAARLKLLAQVGARLEYVLSTDSAEMRENAEALKELNSAIKASSKEQVIDRVAYTWFNRLMALRFMDANEYQPLGVRVVSAKDGDTEPDILVEAKRGNFPEGLSVDKKHVNDLLDGRIPSSNRFNAAYRKLLVAACNHLHTLFPFLFEKLNDYTELLLPDDLTSEFSIVHDVCDGMTLEDCKEVEIIGWLYQFYISERKNEVFASKSKVRKEDIPAATQLFTPRWIVEYMVQNTVGKLWLQNRPNSRLREHMPYFIESASLKAEEYLKVERPEDLTLLDSACGSGHILVYGFELLSKIYEEEGYAPSQIPKLIIENNLFGFEIDERAAQLAGFALLMKARSYSKTVFRSQIQPQILRFRDVIFTHEELIKVLELTYLDKCPELQHDLRLMVNATNFGSLIIPHTSHQLLQQGLAKVKELLPDVDLFQRNPVEKFRLALEQLIPLARRYHCVVDNPPYMGGGNMNDNLAEFVRTHYPNSKMDLMACFIESGLKQLFEKGYLGMINQVGWMFLTSYEQLRIDLLNNYHIDSMLHLGPRVFPEINGEVVQSTSFVIRKSNLADYGVFYRLRSFKDSATKREKFLDILSKSSALIEYRFKQHDFRRIPGWPIAYWVSDKLALLFNQRTIGDGNDVKEGVGTRNDDRFIRYSWEVNHNEIGRNLKWVKTDKAGTNYRWYNHYVHVLQWEDDGYQIRNYRTSQGKLKSRPQNTQYFFRDAVSWGKVGTGRRGFRFRDGSFAFNDAAPSVFGDETLYILGFLNSDVANSLIEIKGDTANLTVGIIKGIPICYENKDDVVQNVEMAVNIVKHYWSTQETCLSFSSNELVQCNTLDLSAATNKYSDYWLKQKALIEAAEGKLNEIFADLFDLERLPSEEGLDSSILTSEFISNAGIESLNLRELMVQLISYSVGCMFGRFALEEPGLILSNQGDTIEDYLGMVGKGTAKVRFLPDADNIIPVLDDEWFKDDVVGRFYTFLRSTFGDANFDKNLAFVEECLGNDIRKFFTKDFYIDHIQRYSKRPIYWMFSSPKGSFNVLIYMHRYTSDTLNLILVNYLRPYQDKLKNRIDQLDRIIVTGSATEQNRANKEKDKLNRILLELQDYERDVFYPLATERIEIDLDDGVLVNYNKFGKAVKEVPGLNDAKTRAKVAKFDWVKKPVVA